MLGGSRRGKKTGTRKVNRPMKGGMGFGFKGALDGGTAGPEWGGSWGGEVTKDGTPIYDAADRPAVVGGRRRKSKKASKKAKKSRRRKTMRGGAQWQSIAPAGGGFTGQGVRGLADWTGYSSKVPAEGAVQNPDGAMKA